MQALFFNWFPCRGPWRHLSRFALGSPFPSDPPLVRAMLDLPLNQRLSTHSAAAAGKPSAPVAGQMAEEGFQEDLELHEGEHGAEDMDDATAVSALPPACAVLPPSWLHHTGHLAGCGAWKHTSVATVVLQGGAGAALPCPTGMRASSACADPKKSEKLQKKEREDKKK